MNSRTVVELEDTASKLLSPRALRLAHSEARLGVRDAGGALELQVRILPVRPYFSATGDRT